MVSPHKPAKWPVSSGEVHPEWRWFWNRFRGVVPLWEGNGVPHLILPPTSPFQFTSFGATWSADRVGPGVVTTAADQCYVDGAGTGNPVDMLRYVETDWSMAIAFDWDGTGGTVANGLVAADRPDGNYRARWFIDDIDGGAANLRFAIQSPTGSFRAATWTGAWPAANSGMHTLVCVRSKDTNGYGYLDGVPLGVQSMGAAVGDVTVGLDQTRLHIGGKLVINGNIWAGGTYYCLAVWPKALTSQQAIQWCKDPWGPFERRRLSIPVAAAPGGFVPFPQPRGLAGGEMQMTGGLQ